MWVPCWCGETTKYTTPRCQRSFNQLQGIKLEERQCGVRGEHYIDAADENLGSAGRERSKVVTGALNMGGLDNGKEKCSC